ncbi:glycosyltransferase family 2 protein [Amnibacterium kyonggiense]
MSGRSGRIELSVLLPVHNGEATIRRAVRSTLADLPAEAELLVHDDASTDRTAAVLDSIADPRLVVRSVERNVGVANALNGLLADARGRLVARMDGDDVTLRGRFVRERAAIDAGDDVVFTSRINFGPRLRSYRPDQTMWPLPPALLRPWLLLENPLAHPSMLARTDVLRAAGGYVPGPAEDYELWLRLAAGGARLRRLAAPGILYRMHPAQVTREAEWRTALSKDEHLRVAYLALAQQLGWTGGDLFTARFSADADARDPAVRAAFLRFLPQALRDLPPWQSRLLSARGSRLFR